MVNKYLLDSSDIEVPITKGIDHDKVSKVVIDICERTKYEIMRCVNCPIVGECLYPKKRLRVLKNEARKISEEVYEEELELDETAEAKIRAMKKRDITFDLYIKDNAYRFLKNDRCVYERKEVLYALQKFVDAEYDITDPRTYLIINELISNILNAGRMNKTFTNLGLLLRKDTATGPVYYSNPLIKTRMEMSKMIVETTEVLDRILKSDEETSEAKTFTEHLKKQLKLHREKNKVIDHK